MAYIAVLEAAMRDKSDARGDKSVIGERKYEVRHVGERTFGIVGMGYVGLPTALALVEAGHRVVGVDLSWSRLDDIAQGRVDLTSPDLERLRTANAGDKFITTTNPQDLAQVD